MMKLPFAATLLAAALSLSAAASASPVMHWSQMLGNETHSSRSLDTGISTGNAATIGVKWMANLFAPYLGSPATAHNTVLNRDLVYAGNERGDLYALNAHTGQVVWSTSLGYGDAIRATPAIAPDGSVWVGTNFNPTLYKVDGATGHVLCSTKSPNGQPVMGSPMIATLSGGRVMVYWDTIDSNEIGPLVGTDESSCSQVFNTPIGSGSWVTPVFGVTGSGQQLVLIGTADPDDKIWAVDATTGSPVWSYATYAAPSGFDVGAAETTGPPGVNGFANGVAYISSEYGDETALDLSNGNVLWRYFVYPSTYNGKRYVISSAALDSKTLVFGFLSGVAAVNAVTGAQIWKWNAPSASAQVDASPAIVGPAGSEVVAFGDLTGAMRIFSLKTGTQLYSYQSGGYIVSSPAIIDGTIFMASSDGFLYALAPGGGNASAPSTTLTSPANNSVIANPNGSVTINGSASDASSVSQVEISVQEGGPSGTWLNASNNTWSTSPVRNFATLANPGAASTGWSFSLAVPPAGANYQVFANTVNSSNIVDKGTSTSFTVSPSGNQPIVRSSTTNAAPGSTFTASGNAFKPGETVTFTLLGATVGQATVGPAGYVPQTEVQVPSNAAFGPTTLTLTGGTSHKAASLTIYISNAWTQAGYGPTRTAHEPNDTIISHTIFVGAPILALDWMYNSGSAINSSPAIADGVAYFGNDGGTLSAVNVLAGSPAWTHTILSHAAIHGSPAIDSVGRIIFGANDGKLYVLSSTGSFVSSVSLGGNVGAPAYTNGKTVVGSSNGSLTMLNVPALTQVWSVNAGSAITANPAWDTSMHMVVAGTANGQIIAYNSQTGAVVWTVTTGGAVNGIAIGINTVYAGSADGHLYALNESDGSQKFNVQGDGPITSVGVNVNNPTFATTHGTMYDYLSDGTWRFQRTYGTPAVTGLGGAGIDFFGGSTAGVLGMIRTTDGAWKYTTSTSFNAAPVVLNGMLFAGAQDGNLYAFVPQGYTPSSRSTVRAGSLTITVDGSGTSCTTPQ